MVHSVRVQGLMVHFLFQALVARSLWPKSSCALCLFQNLVVHCLLLRFSFFSGASDALFVECLVVHCVCSRVQWYCFVFSVW